VGGRYTGINGRGAMATVDFTKDELKSELNEFREEMRGLFREEREYTRAMIRESAEDVKQSIATEFMNFVEHNFDPGMESLQEQISEVRQDMKKMRVVVG
jgi:hypothetical protein